MSIQRGESRGVETVENTRRADILGKAYIKGGDIVRQFRVVSAEYLPETRIFQLKSKLRIFMTRNGVAFLLTRVHYYK